MRTAVGDLGERRIAVACGPGTEAFILQNARNEVADVCFVVDNQNVTGHGLHLSCQLPVAALIFGSSLVAVAASLVSEDGGFVSLSSCFFSGAGSLPSAFGAWPVTANRSRIQAPRCPGRKSDASLSSMRPPWSSSTRPTIASPSPVPFWRVVT